MALEGFSNALRNRAAQNRNFANRTRAQRRATIQRLFEQDVARREAEKAKKDQEKANRTGGLIKAGAVVAGALTGGVAAGAAAGGLTALGGAAVGASLAAPIGDIGASFVSGSGGGVDFSGLSKTFDTIEAAQGTQSANDVISGFQGNEIMDKETTVGRQGFGFGQSVTPIHAPTPFSPPNDPSLQIPRNAAFSTNQRSLQNVVGGGN